MTAAAQASATTLEVRGVTMRFGGVVAVDDVSFAAYGGEVLGVMGPNGAGKTTLFNVISGLQRPTAGLVLLDGMRLTGQRVDQIAARGVPAIVKTQV